MARPCIFEMKFRECSTILLLLLCSICYLVSELVAPADSWTKALTGQHRGIAVQAAAMMSVTQAL
jgi:hypothetical protein